MLASSPRWIHPTFSGAEGELGLVRVPRASCVWCPRSLRYAGQKHSVSTIMHIEPVEIYSDASNAAVMRHPGRQFPGVLVQGDSLYAIVMALTAAQSGAKCLDAEAATELAHATERLNELLEHYKDVLNAHHIKLPF